MFSTEVVVKYFHDNNIAASCTLASLMYEVASNKDVLFSLTAPEGCEWVSKLATHLLDDDRIEVRFYDGVMLPLYLGQRLGVKGGAVVVGDRGKLTLIFNTAVMSEQNPNTMGLVFHEVAHIKQICAGRLVMVEDGSFWDGVFYPIVQEVSDDESVAYQINNWDWEREAYCWSMVLLDSAPFIEGMPLMTAALGELFNTEERLDKVKQLEEMF